MWLYHSLLVLDVLGGDSVESSSALARDDPGVDLESISLLVLADKLQLLKLLETPSDGLGANGSVRLRGAVSALESTIDVGQEADAGVRAEVDLAGKGGDFDVDPVIVEGSEFVAYVRKEVRGPLLT